MDLTREEVMRLRTSRSAGAAERQRGHQRLFRIRHGGNVAVPRPDEDDDEIPEDEARWRILLMRVAKRSRGWAELTEAELARILP